MRRATALGPPAMPRSETETARSCGLLRDRQRFAGGAIATQISRDCNPRELLTRGRYRGVGSIITTVITSQPWSDAPHLFGSFARQVYADAPDIYLEPLGLEGGEGFMLPALYGGDATEGGPDSTFEFLVVLEGPSVSFTRERWKTPWSVGCATAAEAVL